MSEWIKTTDKKNQNSDGKEAMYRFIGYKID